MIDVRKVGDEVYEVTVRAERETRHRVSLDEAYFQKLARDDETREQLIERSFAFLLRNESNTSILAAFDLPVIERYFPGFEKEIRRKS